MSVVDEKKPGLIEQVGIAVNASSLKVVEGREGNVERIAALAISQIRNVPMSQVATGAEAVAEIDASAELGVVLIRLKAGNQRSEFERALQLLVQWMRHQKAYSRWKVRDGDSLVHTFARQALGEWLNDVCPDCDGASWRGLERDSVVTRRIPCKTCRGSGREDYQSAGVVDAAGRKHGGGAWLKRICTSCGGNGKRFQDKVKAIKPRECVTCRGTGRRVANDVARARALGLPFVTYQRHWLSRFEWINARLGQLDRLESNLLRGALR